MEEARSDFEEMGWTSSTGPTPPPRKEEYLKRLQEKTDAEAAKLIAQITRQLDALASLPLSTDISSFSPESTVKVKTILESRGWSVKLSHLSSYANDSTSSIVIS